MTSSALKGQKVEKRRKPNPGQVYAAHLELRRALEAMEELGVEFPGVARDGNGVIIEGAGALSAAIVNVELAVDDSLGECFAQIRALTEEIWGYWPEPEETAKWKTIEEILQRKNWPDAGWVIEQARESRPATAPVASVINAPGGLPAGLTAIGAAPSRAVGGDAALAASLAFANGAPKASAVEVFNAAVAAGVITRADVGPVICHGCSEEGEVERAGVEADPRGFPGLLCADCAEKARADVATGHADLGPDATEEAKKKAAEVEAEYRAKTGAGVTP